MVCFCKECTSTLIIPNNSCNSYYSILLIIDTSDTWFNNWSNDTDTSKKHFPLYWMLSKAMPIITYRHLKVCCCGRKKMNGKNFSGQLITGNLITKCQFQLMSRMWFVLGQWLVIFLLDKVILKPQNHLKFQQPQKLSDQPVFPKKSTTSPGLFKIPLHSRD